MTLYQATYGKLSLLKAEIAGIKATLESDAVVLNRETLQRHLCDLQAILAQRQVPQGRKETA